MSTNEEHDDEALPRQPARNDAEAPPSEGEPQRTRRSLLAALTGLGLTHIAIVHVGASRAHAAAVDELCGVVSAGGPIYQDNDCATTDPEGLLQKDKDCGLVNGPYVSPDNRCGINDYTGYYKDGDCGMAVGTSIMTDNHCMAPTETGRSSADMDCGKKGSNGITSYDDDCGKGAAVGTITPVMTDNNCAGDPGGAPATVTMDQDCGAQASGPWMHGDGDCGQAAGGGTRHKDSDCGQVLLVPPWQFGDSNPP